jgi:hypothetical protein
MADKYRSPTLSMTDNQKKTPPASWRTAQIEGWFSVYQYFTTAGS